VTIYFVDEDKGPLVPYRSALELLGFEVEPIEFADDAYSLLSSCDPASITLVILDLMLAVRQPDDRFNERTTVNWDETGFCLFDELVASRPELFPRRIFLFSAIYKEGALIKAQRINQQYRVPFLRKRTYSNAADFGLAVKRRLEDIDDKQLDDK